MTASGIPYDLLIIGGGINGAGIARDASLRGLRVALLEAHDASARELYVMLAGDPSGVPLPMIGLVRQLYGQALVDGKGDEDYSAIAATAEKLSGVKFKR